MEYFQQLLGYIDTHSVIVILLSLICYVSSLYLPAIGHYEPSMNGHDEYIRYDNGISVLLKGLFLGWIIIVGNIGVIAVYANLIYFYLVSTLLLDDKPSQSALISAILMLVLMFFSFIYKEISGAEIAHIHCKNRVTLWCYGAFLWFFALSSLSSIVFLKYYGIDVPSIWIYLFVFVVYFSLILAVQYYRYHYIANELERKSYFSKWIMLTSKKMSGIPYNPPNNLQIDENSVIDINQAVNGKVVNLHKIPLDKFQFAGYYWHVYDICNQHSCSNIAELTSKKKVDYFYRIKENTRLAKKTYIIENHQREILWSAYSRKKEDSNQYFPDYRRDIYRLFKRLHTTMIDVNSDEFAKKVQGQTFTLESNDSRLFTKFNGMKNSIQLQDKIFYMSNYDLDNFQLWHSEDYIVFVNNTLIFDKWNKLLLFQKNPIKPVKAYFMHDRYRHYHWTNDILKEQGLLDKSYNEQCEQMIHYPNANQIKALRFEYAYEDRRILLSRFKVVNKEEFPQSTSVIVATTDAGEFLFDSSW